MAISPRVFFGMRLTVHAGFFMSILFLISFTKALGQNEKWKTFMAEGDTLYNHEDFQAAIKSYSKSIKTGKLKDKEMYAALYKRAICYYSTGEFVKALDDINKFIPMHPDSPRPVLLKAFIYRELDDEENQFTFLQQAIDMQLISPDLLKWRGNLFLQRKEYARALEDLQMARGMEDDSNVETLIGLTYYNMEQNDSAMVSFNRSIELDAMYTPAYLYAGSINIEGGNFRLAIEYLNLALRIDPGNKDVLFYKGVALVELERLEEGCKCLNRAFYSGVDEAGDYLKQYCYPVED